MYVMNFAQTLVHVQGSVTSTDDLLRANAEGAAKAIILPALVRHSCSCVLPSLCTFTLTLQAMVQPTLAWLLQANACSVN